MLKQSRLRDLAYSLSCDPSLSVISNAFPEVLSKVLGTDDVDVLASQNSFRIGTALSDSPSDYVARLTDAFLSAVRPETKEVILVRVHGVKTTRQMLDEFKVWRNTYQPKFCVNYWDAFDPTLEPGQERFTVLAAV